MCVSVREGGVSVNMCQCARVCVCVCVCVCVDLRAWCEGVCDGAGGVKVCV